MHELSTRNCTGYFTLMVVVVWILLWVGVLITIFLPLWEARQVCCAAHKHLWQMGAFGSTSCMHAEPCRPAAHASMVSLMCFECSKHY